MSAGRPLRLLRPVSWGGRRAFGHGVVCGAGVPGGVGRSAGRVMGRGGCGGLLVAGCRLVVWGGCCGGRLRWSAGVAAIGRSAGLSAGVCCGGLVGWPGGVGCRGGCRVGCRGVVVVSWWWVLGWRAWRNDSSERLVCTGRRGARPAGCLPRPGPVGQAGQAGSGRFGFCPGREPGPGSGSARGRGRGWVVGGCLPVPGPGRAGWGPGRAGFGFGFGFFRAGSRGWGWVRPGRVRVLPGAGAGAGRGGFLCGLVWWLCCGVGCCGVICAGAGTVVPVCSCVLERVW
ncbi:Hypothetical Protein sle_67160 [Streptomyces leeuwenhoekii]|uniref:Uncharacterized protein n=1 Tax=Streptomyces leeuwenhoekii TaxID=1437453 RepID=A0A0F7W2B5_STRLW|nr:Hypothetical Protein sle_67160 [Streptomyces leeuwenhoekii]